MDAMQPGQDQPPSAESLRRGYESLAVSNRGLVIFLIVFLLTAVVIHVGLWVMAKYYAGVTREADVPRSAVPRVSAFTEPKLQPSEDHAHQPWQDLEIMRATERQVFQSLGWRADPTTGTPRIPDDVIQELGAKHGSSSPTTRPADQKGGAR